jgi:hypothetical protein
MASRRSVGVFINTPFDDPYERQFLALLAGIVGLGLNPRSVLELPASHDRRSRLLDLIRRCPYSVHDLSRVQVSLRSGFRVPRFNMPFELGLAVGLALDDKDHEWWLLESVPRRIHESLSDVDGRDPAIHSGTVTGMFEAILDMFGDRPRPPLRTINDLRWVYRGLSQFRETLPRNIYRPDPFRRLVVAARELVQERGRPLLR